MAAFGEAVGGNQGELFNKNNGLFSKKVIPEHGFFRDKTG